MCLHHLVKKYQFSKITIIMQCYLPHSNVKRAPAWPQPGMLVLNLFTSEGWKAELTLVLVIYQVGLLPCRQLLTLVVTTWWHSDWKSNSRPFDCRSNILIIMPPSHIKPKFHYCDFHGTSETFEGFGESRGRGLWNGDFYWDVLGFQTVTTCWGGWDIVSKKFVCVTQKWNLVRDRTWRKFAVFVANFLAEYV